MGGERKRKSVRVRDFQERERISGRERKTAGVTDEWEEKATGCFRRERERMLVTKEKKSKRGK